MKNKILFVSIVLSLIIVAGIVLAQEEILIATPTSATDENIQAQDLEVSEPNILPDSPFYFLKNWSRQVQNLFTFSSVAKAKLKEKFANEKLMEVKKLIEQNKSQETIQKGIENYQKSVEEVKAAAEKIKEKAGENEQVGKFLDKFIQQQTLHQTILEKLETKVSTTTAEKIKQAVETHLEKFGEVMNKLENKEGIQERLEKNLEKISISTLQKISTSTKETIIKIRDKVMEKIQQRNTEGTATGTCITLWDPVCGKNGKTYSSECFAKMAGIETEYKGECTVTVKVEAECKTDADCPQPACSPSTNTAATASPTCTGMKAKCVNEKCKIISTIPSSINSNPSPVQ